MNNLTNSVHDLINSKNIAQFYATGDRLKAIKSFVVYISSFYILFDIKKRPFNAGNRFPAILYTREIRNPIRNLIESE